MPKLRFQFEVEQDAANEQTAQMIEAHIRGLDVARQVGASPQEARFGVLEVVGIISATILIIEKSDELIEKLRKLIKSLKGLTEDVKGLKNVFVEVGNKRIPLTEINEDDPEQLKALTHS
jgi:uncharacterized Fe-S cluster-containing radical SAM superfamily protein